MRMPRTTNDRALAIRMVGVILILAGILLCAYGRDAYSKSGQHDAGSASTGFAIHDRDRGMPLWFGVSSVAIGASFLFVPRRDEL